MPFLSSILATLTALLLASAAHSQNAVYPNCTSDTEDVLTVAQMLDELVDNGPGVDGDVWQTPLTSDVTHIAAGMHWMLEGAVSSAQRRFRRAGMDICLAKSAPLSQPDTVLVYDPDGRDSATSVGLPVLIYRPTVTAELGVLPRVILSIPHAKTESHLADYLTAEALTGALDESGRHVVRAAVVSTIHRCHSETELTGDYFAGVDVAGCERQPCDGEDCVRVMRVSDDAHNAESLFQLFHETLRVFFWDDQVASIHGAGSSFPGMSVSNGSDEQYTGPEQDHISHAVVRWYDELSLQFGDPTNFTTCNNYTPIIGRNHVPHFEDRRCGTQNATRGEDPRLQSDLDSGDAGSPERQYHFLHLEINRDLKDSFPERAKIINSLKRILDQD